MAEIGFTNYDDTTPTPGPTLQERIALLTNTEKLAILDAFALKKLPGRLKYEIATSAIATDLVTEIYREIDRVEEEARSLMRGEVVITPATYDGEGNELTAAVYNTPPSTITALKSDLTPSFTDSFTAAQVGAVVDKMIEYSKEDGSGTAIYYQAEVVK